MNKKLPSLRDIVKQFNIIPKKKFGQNFLFDTNLLNKIVYAAGDLNNFTILEIGSGPGGLTRAILEAGASNLIIVEQDLNCIEAVKSLQEFYPNCLQIINDDALVIKEENILSSKTKIIANLPYNIATVLLFKWLTKLELFSSLTLMFQKEVAQRILAKPCSKEYSRLSVMTQTYCKVIPQFDINARAFWPTPKVTSSVVNFIPKKNMILPSFRILEYLCKMAFSHRRKILKTNLKLLEPNLEQLIEGTNIDLKMRAEELSIEQYSKLSFNYQKLLSYLN